MCDLRIFIGFFLSLFALALSLLRLLFEFLLMLRLVIVAIITRITFGYVQCLLAWCFQTNKVMLQFQHSLSSLSRGKNIDTKGLHKLSEIFEQCQRVTVRSEAQNWNFLTINTDETFSGSNLLKCFLSFNKKVLCA